MDDDPASDDLLIVMEQIYNITIANCYIGIKIT